MSLQSPLSIASDRSELELVFDDMPRPQRPIERMSSNPSLSHSATTATSDDIHDNLNAELLTPNDPLRSMQDEVEILSPVERKGGFRGLTKSMQSLRGRAKADKERSRSTSRKRPPMPVLEPAIKISPPSQVTQPVPIPRSSSTNAVPTRPKPQRSGSSFSSFIRKLTGGKSAKASPPPAIIVPQSMPARTATHTPREPVRKPTLAINTMASPPSRPPVLRKTSLPLDIMATPKVTVPVHESAPMTAPADSDPYVTLMIDPRTVPLPPSPPSPALVLPEDETEPDFSLSPSSYDKVIVPGPSSLNCSPSFKQIRQVGKLRLEDSPSSRTQTEAIQEEEESEEEEDDVVQPLRSMKSESSRRVVESPMTASTMNDEVQTPTSPSYSDNVMIRQNSGSPPRSGSGSSPNKYDAGRRPEVGLGRKESKWRRSVMNLSGTLNGTSKKESKAPPTSYDNYLAHQQRMANHRRSCAPTLHSTASVSAEIRQIKDKEQQDVADTFFLS